MDLAFECDRPNSEAANQQMDQPEICGWRLTPHKKASKVNLFILRVVLYRSSAHTVSQARIVHRSFAVIHCYFVFLFVVMSKYTRSNGLSCLLCCVFEKGLMWYPLLNLAYFVPYSLSMGCWRLSRCLFQ